jgi:hypothetical protein
MNTSDRKKLWALAGNRCSFPGCPVVLASDDASGRTQGHEAHIKGEKLGAPRYDPEQSKEERESYENRIILCPTDHNEIDYVHPERYPLEVLLRMKADHERRMERNHILPELEVALSDVFRRFHIGREQEQVPTVPVTEQQDTRIVRVDASLEGGIRTSITLAAGQRVTFFATGLISYDGGYNYTTPEGIICNEYGINYTTADEGGNRIPTVWPHEDAYRTDGGELGIIGSLIGWIGAYSPDRAIKIGTKRELEVLEEGELCLAVNDAKGTYGDNKGEFRVEIRIEENEPQDH